MKLPFLLLLFALGTTTQTWAGPEQIEMQPGPRNEYIVGFLVEVSKVRGVAFTLEMAMRVGTDGKPDFAKAGDDGKADFALVDPLVIPAYPDVVTLLRTYFPRYAVRASKTISNLYHVYDDRLFGVDYPLARTLHPTSFSGGEWGYVDQLCTLTTGMSKKGAYSTTAMWMRLAGFQNQSIKVNFGGGTVREALTAPLKRSGLTGIVWYSSAWIVGQKATLEVEYSSYAQFENLLPLEFPPYPCRSKYLTLRERLVPAPRWNDPPR